MDLYSYVVAYDSGFAPNPFYGLCTLATCKPEIRKNAQIGDWILGSGSANKTKYQGGRLVYAMCVSEVLTFNQYFEDSRFRAKRPLLTGSRKQARGDNIYHQENGNWGQLNSYHSNADGTVNLKHVSRDTKVNRILISTYYCYFGKNGPELPDLLGKNRSSLCHKGRNYSKFRDNNELDKALLSNFVEWFKKLNKLGYVSSPFDWSDTR